MMKSQTHDERPNPSDWSCLLSCAREDIVVVQINVVVGLVLMLVLVSLLLCARELALPIFNPKALRDMVFWTPLEL
jgi:hypothetical protein